MNDIIWFKYLIINQDIKKYLSYEFVIINTRNFKIGYFNFELPNLQESSKTVLANKIDKKIAIDFKDSYIIKLLGYSVNTVTVLATLTLNNLYKYSTDKIISAKLFTLLPDAAALQTNTFIQEAPTIHNALSENFYFINHTAPNVFGKFYFVLFRTNNSNMNQINSLTYFDPLIDKRIKLIYNKYANMLVVPMPNKTITNFDNDFQIHHDTYDNNKILSPAFSYLSVFVEKNISKMYHQYLNQLNSIIDINSLIVNNYAFINKSGLFDNNLYAPYDGQILNYVMTKNCIYLKVVNNYFTPNTYIERSFREILYGHRDGHEVFVDNRYAPQPAVNLVFYIIIVCKNTDNIKTQFASSETSWINKGQLLFTKYVTQEIDEIDVITVFNRHIKFNPGIVKYLSKNITCLMKDHDIIGELL